MFFRHYFFQLYKIKGPPGAGKSTTAGRLAKEHGFIYYEADSFFMFCNPFINPNDDMQLANISSQKPLKVKRLVEIMNLIKATVIQKIIYIIVKIGQELVNF